MEQQLQANQIRIQVLEKENTILYNSIEKIKERYSTTMVLLVLFISYTISCMIMTPHNVVYQCLPPLIL